MTTQSWYVCILLFPQVYISYTKMTLNYEIPKSVVHKPKLKELLKGQAVFQDDTIERIDEIVYCTGNRYYFSHRCPLYVTVQLLQDTTIFTHF